mmetsp:Transcript_26416/g.64365  ORF Transcript_26416/g.64365 Transcript_26416/m.64365 type:complete len:543 (+) Transcript_26416:261-1889(+)|eukprot:CAMPEP_0113640590 /NCGR_PEP_ID=MMETSP0017_2-20120614/21305_1 /TAXON_ID=2856 /ORGANISM="Cylindrotheca closterium" /LENGTH=542 /DNA_ID=CAMNT_0000551883 /DNA_START=251 /DNA_END=1879 /DNA_ORIENTATION=- /assembly_acc=CAM_ASM_000147
MSSKHVNFDDGSNSTKEFERVPAQEKGAIWYSKEEKESNRKEMHAEVMMEHAKVIVTKTVLEMEEYKGQTEDSEQVQTQVFEVLSQGVDGVIDFLAKHGQGELPTFSRVLSAAAGGNADAPSADSSGGGASSSSSPTKFSVEENAAADEEAKQQVRDLVKHQIVVLMQSGRVDNSFVSHEDLEKKADEIMLLPRMEILRFLEEKPTLPASTAPAKPPVPYNWMNDGKHGWEELPPPIQEAATVLGYDPESWVEKKQPEKSDKVWELLTNEQQEAAIRIGFNPYSWDGIEPSEQGESEHFSDSSSASSEDSDDDEDGDGETKERPPLFSPETQMKNTVRDLVKEKLLEAVPFNEDNVDSTVDTVMELPKPQIVAFLQHPLPEHWTTPQAAGSGQNGDDSEVGGDDSEVGGRESAVFSTFVLEKDEDDDLPMDDDSSSDEEEGVPQKALGTTTTSKPFEEEEDEFLANFLHDSSGDLDMIDMENDYSSSNNNNNINETTPLIPGKRSLPSHADDDPKKHPSATKVILIGLGIAAIGWIVYKKMQ